MPAAKPKPAWSAVKAAPGSIRIYRGGLLIGHVYTANEAGGWRSSQLSCDTRPSRKLWPSPEAAAGARWGAAARDAVRVMSAS